MTVFRKHLALRELRANIRDQDPIKARLVLDHFHEFSAMEQAWVIETLAECGDDFALPLLVTLAGREKETPLKFPELTELILRKALDSPGLVVDLLGKNSAERPYYAKIAGELALQEATPLLTGMIMAETDPALLAAAITALAGIGDAESVRVIAEMLYAGDNGLVGCAVEALARFATPGAMIRLAEKLGQDEATDLRIIDVFARNQDEFSLHKLNELLRSRSLVRRNYCKKKLVEIGGKCVPLLIENLSGNDSDSVIDSLHILRELGDKTARFPVRQLINSHPRNANVRFAAYETLASLPCLKGDYVLASGLVDPVENVRITAARAIDHNLDEVLAAGISNMINRKDEEARGIVKAILDGQAGRIFLALLDQEYFRTTARAYLSHKAHPEIRDFFAGLLERHGDDELAAGIRPGAAPDEAVLRDKVCAVDDSRMILNVYRTVLNELNFAPVLFQEPEKALAWLEEERPLLICTDLNMPEMTGLDFIRNVRTRYAKEELPVILVTTQDDRKDNEEAMGAGANAVLRKPFDAASLAAVLMQVFGDR